MIQGEFNLHNCLIVTELVAQSRREIWSISDCHWTRNHNHLHHQQRFNHLTKLTKLLICVVSIYLHGASNCMFLSFHMHDSELFHTRQLPEWEGTSCSKQKNIWGMSDCNSTWTHNHIVHKQTLNHLGKLPKWLSCVASTYLQGAFVCMFFSCHVGDLKLIHTL